MIRTKELMLGNWVLAGTKTQFPMQVVSIFQDEVYLDFEGNEGDVWEDKEEALFPVQLTNELLIKNGFEKLNFGLFIATPTYELEIDKNTIHVSFSLSNSEDKDWHVIIWNKRNEHIMSGDFMNLHELQNLLNMAGIKMEFRI